MDDKRIDVSVIIATYNVAPYIQRAINSALEQQGLSVEVIVIDDCSTDSTVEIVQSIPDTRLRLIQLKDNGGPSIARNVGLDAARGEWISILDGDDTFTQGRLARCITAAVSLNANIVVDNLNIINEVNHVNTGKMFPNFKHNKEISLRDFIEGNQLFLGGYTMGYLKPIFSSGFLKKNNIKYDVSIRIGEDYILLADALASGARCFQVSSDGYNYTVREGSTSHRLTEEDVQRILAADHKFSMRHKLTREELKTQKKRERALKEAYSYTSMVTAIKNRNLRSFLYAFLSSPIAARNLSRPIIKRLARFSLNRS